MSQGLFTCCEVGKCFLHELPHRAATVIARDIVVQVAPHAFDAIVVRAVRRQKMQTDSGAQGGQRDLRPLTAVDRVVVQNDVDAFCIRVVVTDQLPKLGDEQVAVFTVPVDPGESPGLGIQRSAQIALLVLARRMDALLGATQHVVRADLGIQMDAIRRFTNDGKCASRC